MECTKTYHDAVRIGWEKELYADIYSLLGGATLKELIEDARLHCNVRHYTLMHAGTSAQVTAGQIPQLHKICQAVLKKLNFTEPVEFFVTNSTEMNAVSLQAADSLQSHLIILNSALIKELDADELKFAIGHEIGHLINRTAELLKLIEFVFPDMNRAPLLFQNKIALWRKLAELNADRYGFIAAPRFNKCITNFFKMSSGLASQWLKLNVANYIKNVDSVIVDLQKEPVAFKASHPVNPVRIKALQHFSASRLYRDIAGCAPVRPDKKLDGHMAELINLLMVLGESEHDVQRKQFIACAGLLMARHDEAVAESEYDYLVEALGRYTMFPPEFLGQIMHSSNLLDMAHQAAATIILRSPEERHRLFDFLIDMVMKDREIKRSEVDLLYALGGEFFDFTHQEMALLIAAAVRERFLPIPYQR